MFSEDDFIVLNEKVKGGSSPSIRYFENVNTKAKWIGKCSDIAITKQKKDGTPVAPDYIKEYKEYLAIKLYNLFDVGTPDIALSNQVLSIETQEGVFGYALKDYKQQNRGKLPLNVPDIDKPRLHLMSRYIDDFRPLGERFIKDYHQQPYRYYYNYQILNQEGKYVPLKGFGKALAVACFLYDYDCVGNSGTNMGYVLKGTYAEIVKIDAGEAFAFFEDQSFSHDPRDRDVLVTPANPSGAEGYGKFHFKELNRADQKEFALTVQRIMDCSCDSLELIFKELIEVDSRFEKLLRHFLERKVNFIDAFSPEIKEFISTEGNNLVAQVCDQLNISLRISDDFISDPIDKIAYMKIINGEAPKITNEQVRTYFASMIERSQETIRQECTTILNSPIIPAEAKCELLILKLFSCDDPQTPSVIVTGLYMYHNEKNKFFTKESLITFSTLTRLEVIATIVNNRDNFTVLLAIRGHLARLFVNLASKVNGESDEAKLFRMLAKTIDVNMQRIEDGETALHMASAHGITENIKLLLQYKAEVNVQNNYKTTPLHVASMESKCESLKLLVENGGDLNILDKKHRTPLHVAMERFISLQDESNIEFIEAVKSVSYLLDQYNKLPLEFKKFLLRQLQDDTSCPIENYWNGLTQRQKFALFNIYVETPAAIGSLTPFPTPTP